MNIMIKDILEVGDVFRILDSSIMLKDKSNYKIISLGDYTIKIRDQDNTEWVATITLDKFKRWVEENKLFIFPKKETSFSNQLKY